MTTDSMLDRYDVQVISHRYIRKVTLESYVNSKIDEFGTECKCEIAARNNRITFTALRKLTNDELDVLQERSGKNEKPLFI